MQQSNTCTKGVHCPEFGCPVLHIPKTAMEGRCSLLLRNSLIPGLHSASDLLSDMSFRNECLRYQLVCVSAVPAVQSVCSSGSLRVFELLSELSEEDAACWAPAVPFFQTVASPCSLKSNLRVREA
jgi:hypothetical protein